VQDPVGDDEALDFAGAFVDFGDAGVAVVALDGVWRASGARNRMWGFSPALTRWVKL